MRVVALISGGKDSTFSMMKCKEHGHEVVALANLHPVAAEDEEIDSFMYQTVGHAHVEAIARAMELPLFRREIRGAAVEQGLQYSRTEGDEVEDLHALLSEVVRQMPDVGAVCSGAVLSSYQRIRVEEVCSRLGLASLAFLWQRSQRELLREMVAAGVDAILVKVASMGLKPAHLGRSVGSLAPAFEKLNAQFGFHECGEGGEYETFTLDCPLFRSRIVPVGSTVVQHSPDVALLRFASVELQPKSDDAAPTEVAESPVAGEGTEDKGSDSDGVEGSDGDGGDEEPADAADARGTDDSDDPTLDPSWMNCCADAAPDAAAGAAADGVETAIEIGNGMVQIGAYGAASSADFDADDAAAAEVAATQLTETLGKLREALRAERVEMGGVLLVRLYLARMAHYATVNKQFATFFEEYRCVSWSGAVG